MIRVGVISLITCLTIVSTTKAQDFIFDPDAKKKTDSEVYKEGEEKEKKKLLLISYKPVMHIPDPSGDVELVMKSGQDMGRTYNRIRQGLDVSLMEKFKDGFAVTSLLRNNDESRMDLDRVYGTANYNYEERPTDIEPNAFGKLCCPSVLGSTDKKPSKDQKVEMKKGQISSRAIDRERQYMNVSIPDTTMIAYLRNRYDVDIFVFVNQLELKKDFASGDDVAYAKYGREVKVHYSVFDKAGDQLYGNASIGKVEKKHDNVNEIISLTFPEISNDVFNHIPGAHQSEEMKKLDKKYQKKAESQNILKKD